MKKNQRHKIRVNVARIISQKKFCPTWAEFSPPTSDQVGGISEILLLTNLDRSGKSNLLLRNLQRSLTATSAQVV